MTVPTVTESTPEARSPQRLELEFTPTQFYEPQNYGNESELKSEEMSFISQEEDTNIQLS